MTSLIKTILAHCPMDEAELLSIISTAARRYKTYQIPKKSGLGFRTIAQPAPEVKRIQRIVVDKFISKWPIHDAATAYRHGLSIRDHAARHVNSKYLLKLDFSDFFPSIGVDAVQSHIERHTEISNSEKLHLMNILVWRNKMTGVRCLSIGAPSSPFVSNSILFEFDHIVFEYCKAHDITYSRYADDLAFSTNAPRCLEAVHNFVRATLLKLNYPTLRLNDKKTVNVSLQHPRILVGLNLTPDGSVSIGRERKRQIRAQLHKIATGQPIDTEISSLRGTLAFVWSVEPAFIKSMVTKYGKSIFEKLELPFS